MTRHATPIVVVAVLLLASGCGDDGSVSDAGDASTDTTVDADSATGVPLETVPDRIAGVYCAQFEACLGSLAGLFFGANDCQDFFGLLLEDTIAPGLMAGDASGDLVYHPELMEACLAALDALGCALFDSRLPPECQLALEGTIPIGETCSEDFGCVGDAFCEFTGSCLMGACTAPRAAGGICAEDEGCVSGTACVDGICVAPARAGEACGGGVAPECIAGALCAGDDEMTSTPGSCLALSSLTTEAESANCDPDGGPLCQEGLSCVVMGASATCVAPVPDFGRCFFGLPDPCPRGQYCDAVIGSEGDCTALPAAGSPCLTTPSTSGVCATGLTCVTGTCLPIERLGESCTVDSQCYSQNCDLASCMLPNRCL